MNIKEILRESLEEYRTLHQINYKVPIKSIQPLRVLKDFNKEQTIELINSCIIESKEIRYPDSNLIEFILHDFAKSDINLTADEILHFYKSSKKCNYPIDRALHNVLLNKIEKFVDEGNVYHDFFIKILEDQKIGNNPLTADKRWDQRIEVCINKLKKDINNNVSLDAYFSNHGVLGEYLTGYFQDTGNLNLSLLETLVSKNDKSSPTQKWLKTINSIIKEFGEQKFIDFALELFRYSIRYLDDIVYKDNYKQEGSWRMSIMSEKNEDFVRSVVWAFSTLDFEKYLDDLVEFAKWSGKKIPWYSALQPRIATALIYTFSKLPSDTSITILTSLKKNVKNSQLLKSIDKYISVASIKAGVNKDDLEDKSIPRFGLNNLGVGEVNFGNITATIKIEAHNSVVLEWTVEGKLQKSIPAPIKVQYPNELKLLQRNLKEIRETISSQIKRLENCFIEDRNWSYSEWYDNLLHHGLLSCIVKPFIWQFSIDGRNETLILINNVWVDINGNKAEFSGSNPTLRLWHPIYSSAEEVLRWRRIVQKYQINQPFKQVYREVYLLTEAERNSGNYTNRFAAHILNNYPFGALCKLRNWKGFNQYHGGGTPELNIKKFNIKAQYAVNSVYHHGHIELLSSDRVRFYSKGQLMELEDVPDIIFSEALRDVDLFVSVSSIGNDPSWLDGGQEFGQEYWQSYSFGELSEMAKTRKTLLSEILPKLKIANVCRIEGNFLLVNGKLRTYKIHIGSSNILMEPNYQYLCIVVDVIKTEKSKVFIPFNGDTGLSIILSKAMMLANDDKISDPTIISQIR